METILRMVLIVFGCVRSLVVVLSSFFCDKNKMQITRQGRRRIIRDYWEATASTVDCIIEEVGQGGNSSGFFSLTLEGGQIDKGNLELCGEFERTDFIKLLKTIVKEMEELK